MAIVTLVQWSRWSDRSVSPFLRVCVSVSTPRLCWTSQPRYQGNGAKYLHDILKANDKVLLAVEEVLRDFVAVGTVLGV